MRNLQLRDAILARFVPGFKYALENRETHRFRDVPVTLHHLELFMISQQMPLHRYPVHALECISASQDSSKREEFTRRLEVLTQVHSRFVLLLQSLVHSSSLPVYEQPEESFNPRTPKNELRELSFPAPLSLSFDVEAAAVPEIDTVAAPRPSYKRHTLPKMKTTSPSSPLLSQQSLPKRRFSSLSRRLSFFRTSSKVPPPPPTVPRSLQFYSASWRRRDTSISYALSELGADDSPLERPHRRFASVNNSRDSSLSSPASSMAPMPVIRSSSPHDIQMAISRTRAPILRVFVPCAVMDEDAIAACEEQLFDCGLWGHLSTGDVVCNIGFVPETTGNNGGRDESDRDRQWLLFDGSALVLFAPPSSPPLDDPLTLPSPFYYAHILAAHTNQIYNIMLPPSDFEEAPEPTLVYSTSKVPSPHSHAGFASVKKYMWIARVTRLARTQFSNFGEGEAIGQGWKGEWVLEGDGTCEGRQVLVDCIRGCETEKRQWEFVREKSGGGRIWIKLLHSAPATTSPTADK
ncbi:hypothetical protein HWV62_3492 [Athelia sp. TMB]|nr:hypothetical protein HWV62_3492 [Athelia sp. TMB]